MIKNKENPSGNKFHPLKLNLRKPVPSDIEIAQEAEHKLVTQVAEEVGDFSRRNWNYLDHSKPK